VLLRAEAAVVWGMRLTFFLFLLELLLSLLRDQQTKKGWQSMLSPVRC
jgi:hypothetical protein